MPKTQKMSTYQIDLFFFVLLYLLQYHLGVVSRLCPEMLEK